MPDFICTACETPVPESVPYAMREDGRPIPPLCPTCGRATINNLITQVAASKQLADDGLSDRQAPNEVNPFSPPQALAKSDEKAGSSNGHGPLDSGYALSDGIALFKENAGVLILALLLMVLGSIMISLTQNFVLSQTDSQSSEFWLYLFIFFCMSQVIQVFLTTGLIMINLEIASGRKPNIGMLFAGGQWFLRFFVASFLYHFVVGVGMLALIVPGIYLAIRYWAYPYFIVDDGCGVFESFRRSRMAMVSNMREGLILLMSSVGIYVLGLLFLGIGLLVAVPVVNLAWTIAYFMISAQSFRQASYRRVVVRFRDAN